VIFNLTSESLLPCQILFMLWVQLHLNPSHCIRDQWSFNVNVSYWLLQRAEVLEAVRSCHIWHWALGSHCSLNALATLSTCWNYRIIKVSDGVELVSDCVFGSKLASIIKLETAVSSILRSSNHYSLSLRWPRSKSFTLSFELISSYDILGHRHVS